MVFLKFFLSLEFVWNEYRMNYFLSTFKKTSVVITQGFLLFLNKNSYTMGGGCGLSRPSRYRICTGINLYLYSRKYFLG
jgi:hypothetical protein